MTGELGDGALTARFGLLASAITGRRMMITCITDPAGTDGRAIWVEPSGDVRAQVLLQAALLRAGSLEAVVVRQLFGRPSLTRRYLAVEGRRALLEISNLVANGVCPEVDRLSMIVSSPEESLAVARSRVRVPTAPVWFGQIRPRQLLASGALAAGDEAIARALGQRALGVPEEMPDEQDDDEDEYDSRSIFEAVATMLGDNPLARVLRNQLGTRDRSVSGPGGQGGTATGNVGRRSRGNSMVIEAPREWDVIARDLVGPRLHLYPEWVDSRAEFRPNWCSVVEHVPHPSELVPLERPARHDGLRRALGPLGLGLQRYRRQPGGYDIDLDAAVNAQIARRAGNRIDDAVYIDNRRRRRDLAVLVLLDASGSVSELDPSGSALYRRQRDTAAGLIDTFAILGDRVAGYAFRSAGRDVRMIRIKAFGDIFGELEMARLGGVGPDGFTRLGAAVRHATELLSAVLVARHRVLIVITDGFPYDSGYEGSYAEGDSRHALLEARERGIGCLALNLGSTTDEEVLERVFGTALHATGANIDELAPRMRSLIVRAIETARRDQHALPSRVPTRLNRTIRREESKR